MIYYNDVFEDKIGAIGFGTMRLPLIPGGKKTDIDQTKVDEMFDYAIEHGINYFDTAYPYHGFMSEIAIGKSLARYDRSRFLLADKFPGHQFMDDFDVEGIFQIQLEKCGVDYFDYYLLHNVNNATVANYNNPKFNIIDRLYELKKQGKIGHLGMSAHGDYDCLAKFMDLHGDKIEFCQMQLNYLDWTLQNGKGVYELFSERNIPILVMEPVRGGKLATMDEDTLGKLKAFRPDEKPAGWAFRFLQGLDNVKVILSGMTTLDQVKEQCATFETKTPATEEETEILFSYAEKVKDAVPCTRCGYCLDGCPMQIDIPRMIAFYHDCRVAPDFNIEMQLTAIPEEHRPLSCIGCGQCASMCPQGIDIPALMPVMAKTFETLPSWTEASKVRVEMAKKVYDDFIHN